MMRHRIIQIAASDGRVVVLCEDGSLWQRFISIPEERWVEIPSPTVEQRRLAEANAR